MSIYSNLTKTLSTEGAEFIADWEGVELTAYQDVKGIWTIGIGHIRTAKRGMVITEERAIDLFIDDAARYINGINQHTSAPLTQKHFDALVSLCFNIGIAGFAGSSVCRELNMGDYWKAANKFLLWDKVTDMGHLRTVQGLTNRRLAERKMFLEGTPEEWIV